MVDRNQAMTLLNHIEAELKQLSLWQADIPSIEALSSEQPFCCDTLRFEQWLQFILIPRMSALLEGGYALPTKIAVAPMAEQAFAATLNKTRTLVALILQFDELLSQQ